MQRPKTTDELVARLWSFPAFRDLQEADLYALCKDATLQDFIPGQVVFEQGDLAKTALLLLNGRLVAQVERGAEIARVGECRAGEIVGETALLQRETQRNATVHAAIHSSCMVIGPEMFSMEDDRATMALEQYLVTTFTRRIRKTNEAIQSFWKANPLDAAADGEPSEAPVEPTSRLRSLLSGFWK